MDKQAVWLELDQMFQNKYRVAGPSLPANMAGPRSIMDDLHYWKVQKAVSKWRGDENYSS